MTVRSASATALAPLAPLRRRLSRFEPVLFIGPFVVLILIFNFYTFYTGARMSFTDAQFINPGEWIGVQNYKDVLTDDPDFWPAVLHTLLYATGCLITQVPAALILAVALNNIKSRLRGIMRASFYVPVLINTVITALVFRSIFNPDTGALNWFLGVIGLPNNTRWLYDPTYSIPLMVAVAFWQWTGYHMVYLLASLQSIDPSLYEVARIDGASAFRSLIHITLPGLRPALTFVMVTSAIGAMQLFEYPFLLFPNAGYGPGKAAMTMVPFIYYNAFSSQFRVGYASAAGWILFFMILAVSLLQIRFLGLGKADD